MSAILPAKLRWVGRLSVPAIATPTAKPHAAPDTRLAERERLYVLIASIHNVVIRRCQFLKLLDAKTTREYLRGVPSGKSACLSSQLLEHSSRSLTAGEKKDMPAVKSPQKTETVDPKSQGPKPEFDQEKIAHPGSPDEMNPKPDHGEQSYKGYGRLKDRSALVTGGDSGIGRAVAIAFAREGADVLLSYLPEEEQEARETARLVEATGRQTALMPGDIGNEQLCEELIDKTISEFGKIDTIANVAGYQMTHESLDEISTGEFDH